MWKKRYLLIIGGEIVYKSVEQDDMDPKVCKSRTRRSTWSLCSNNDYLKQIMVLDLDERSLLMTHQLHDGITNHSSVLLSKESNIYLVGDKNKILKNRKTVLHPFFAKIRLKPNRLPWICEREIWIAFYKNIQNQKCVIANLPKDLILFILNLCSWTLYEQANTFSETPLIFENPYGDLAGHKYS